MGSGRGWLAGDWLSTGGILNITVVACTAGFHWWCSGNITRTQNVSEYSTCLYSLYAQFVNCTQHTAQASSTVKVLAKNTTKSALHYSQWLNIQAIWAQAWKLAQSGWPKWSQQVLITTTPCPNWSDAKIQISLNINENIIYHFNTPNSCPCSPVVISLGRHVQ